MRQAIWTKFLGPTNMRGSRVKASCSAGSVTLGWDHALNPEDNHAAAMKALALKLGWESENWHGGDVEHGYVYVQCVEGCEVK